VFDIVSFYPSISDSLLSKALDWAENFVIISAQDRENIFEARKSMLVYGGEIWTKKSDPNFDVAMGSYDGAEVCDLCGLYLLSELRKEKLNANIGGYKDDFLAASRSSPRQIEITKKKICKVFADHGLEITAEANQKVIKFLDVEFNLFDGSFRPYLKEGDIPLYVNLGSNHPPSILKNIPASINRRLSALSSNEAKFDSVKSVYQEALAKAGYNYQLKYEPPSPLGVKKVEKGIEKLFGGIPLFLLMYRLVLGRSSLVF